MRYTYSCLSVVYVNRSETDLIKCFFLSLLKHFVCFGLIIFLIIVKTLNFFLVEYPISIELIGSVNRSVLI